MALTTKDRLYNGNPRGVQIYSSNRSSYNITAGGGGLTEIPDKYVTNNELLVALQGDTGSFTGGEMTNGEIMISYSIDIDEIFFSLFQNGKKINPKNYSLSVSYGVITLSIAYPYQDTDVFDYRIR